MLPIKGGINEIACIFELWPVARYKIFNEDKPNTIAPIIASHGFTSKHNSKI